MLLLELDREIKRSEFATDPRNPHGCFTLEELNQMFVARGDVNVVESGQVGTIHGVTFIDSTHAPLLAIEGQSNIPIFEVRQSGSVNQTQLVMIASSGTRYVVSIDDINHTGAPILRASRI